MIRLVLNTYFNRASSTTVKEIQKCGEAFIESLVVLMENCWDSQLPIVVEAVIFLDRGMNHHLAVQQILEMLSY